MNKAWTYETDDIPKKLDVTLHTVYHFAAGCFSGHGAGRK